MDAKFLRYAASFPPLYFKLIYFFFLFYISLSTRLVVDNEFFSIDPRFVTRARKNGRIDSFKKHSEEAILSHVIYNEISFLAHFFLLRFERTRKNKKNQHLGRFIQFVTSEVRLNSPRYFPFPSLTSPGIFFFAPRSVLFAVALFYFFLSSPLQFGRFSLPQRGRKISKTRVVSLVHLSTGEFSPLLSATRGSFLLIPREGVVKPRGI